MSFKNVVMGVVLVALPVLSGCATGYLTERDAELERQSKEYAVQNNNVIAGNNQSIADRNCVIADATAFSAALARAEIFFGKRSDEFSDKERDELLARFYVPPSCVRDRNHAAVTGGRYGVTPHDLAWTTLEETCRIDGPVKTAITAREMGLVMDEKGNAREHFNAIMRRCAQWHRHEMERRYFDECIRARLFVPYYSGCGHYTRYYHEVNAGAYPRVPYLHSWTGGPPAIVKFGAGLTTGCRGNGYCGPGTGRAERLRRKAGASGYYYR